MAKTVQDTKTDTVETPNGACAQAGPIRPAGPGCMKNPPESWDEVDEDSDESFPASDAPGNY